MSQRVLVLSDTHVGSNVALAPEELILESNNRILANEIQLALLQEFYNMVDEVGTVDLLVLNGDLVEGTNYYGEGAGCLTTSMSEQAKTAIELLSDIRCRKVVGCRGTAYHGKKNPNMDHQVIEGLGGVCMDEVSLTIEGLRFYANHRTPVRMVRFETRPQSVAQDILLGELNSMDFGHYDIICKAHVHYYIGLDMGKSLGIVCPCFKGRDEFAKGAANPFAFNPSIGYVMFDIEDDGDFSWTKSVKNLKGNNLIKTFDINEIPSRF